MQHYATFDELIQAIESLQKTHPEWKRLDGNEKDGNRTVFATFRYQYKTWKIHSDTKINKLIDAQKIIETGEKPFRVTHTEKGTPALILSDQLEDVAEGLYIYLKK